MCDELTWKLFKIQEELSFIEVVLVLNFEQIVYVYLWKKMTNFVGSYFNTMTNFVGTLYERVNFL